MVRETNWDNKPEALERLRELYPNMKDFLFDICYDLYTQSKTDTALQEEIEKYKDHDFTVPPKFSDYEEVINDGGVEIQEAGTYETWYCSVCHCHDTKKRSEDNNNYCEFCWKYEEK